MTEVTIYLAAPRRQGRKWVRSVKIEESTYSQDGRSYTPGEMLLDEDVPCSEDTPDRCFVIRGRVEAVL